MSQFSGTNRRQNKDGRYTTVQTVGTLRANTVIANTIQASSGAGTPARQAGSFTVYVAAAGDDANDGLTAGTPVLSFSRALEVFKTVAYDEFVLSIANDFTSFDPTVELPRPIQVDSDTGGSDFVTHAIDLTCIAGHCASFRFLGNPDTYDIATGDYSIADYDIATLFGDGNPVTNIPSTYFKKIVVADTSGANSPQFVMQDGEYYVTSDTESATEFFLLSNNNDESGIVSFYGGSTTPLTEIARNTTARTALLALCNVTFERLSFESPSEEIVGIDLYLSTAPSLYYYGCHCQSTTVLTSSTICMYFGTLFGSSTSLRNVENIEFHECRFQSRVDTEGVHAKFKTCLMRDGLYCETSYITFDRYCVLVGSEALDARSSEVYVRTNLLLIANTESTIALRLQSSLFNLWSSSEIFGYAELDMSDFKSNDDTLIRTTASNCYTLKNGSSYVCLEGNSFSSAVTAIVLRSGSRLIIISGATNGGAGSNVYQRGTATASTTLTADDADTGVANTEGTMALIIR